MIDTIPVERIIGDPLKVRIQHISLSLSLSLFISIEVQIRGYLALNLARVWR